MDILLHRETGFYKAGINGHGTSFHILAGRHKYGNYLCIPNHNVGCPISSGMRSGSALWCAGWIPWLHYRACSPAGPCCETSVRINSITYRPWILIWNPWPFHFHDRIFGAESCRIFDRSMPSQAALRNKLDRRWNNNSLLFQNRGKKYPDGGKFTVKNGSYVAVSTAKHCPSPHRIYHLPQAHTCPNLLSIVYTTCRKNLQP